MKNYRAITVFSHCILNLYYMNKFRLILVILGLFSFVFSYSQTSNSIVGIWLSEEKDAKIEISQKGDYFTGKIIWMDEPNDTNGKLKLDVNNPDEKLRNKPILGLEIMKGFTYDAKDAEWSDGKIYDPKSGSYYNAYLWFEEGESSILKLRGYIGLPMMGKTTDWTRIK